MKRNNMTKIIIIGIISLVFVACSKDENKLVEQNLTSQIDESSIIDNSIYPLISVENGVLQFKSMEYYESILSDESKNNRVEELTKYLSTTSFKSYGKKFKEKSEYDETFMDAIMNENKVVKIGEWFIYIDIPSEKVLVISEKEENAYSTLLKNSSNPNIKKFSIGDDVLNHLINNTDAQQEGCGGIGGGVYRCYSNVYNGKIVKTFSSGVVWRLNPFVRFFRAGIYYRLSSQFEIWRFPTASSTGGGQVVPNITSGNIEVEMFIKSPQAWWKKRPCKSSSVGSRAGGYHYSQSIYGNYAKTVYIGTRNLNGYYFYVKGRVKYPNGKYSSESPYGGRNINSPY
jgi:Txe/YoeB family toxin of Txe-Axe toxin-antitoxin module